MNRFYKSTAIALIICIGPFAASAQTPLGDAESSNSIESPVDSVLPSLEPQDPVLDILNDSSVSTLAEDTPATALPVTSDNTALDQILGTQTGTRSLDSQNIDPNQSLRDALRASSRQGANFIASPPSLFLNTVEGESAKSTITLVNTGDEPGRIFGINNLREIDGLVLTNNCAEVLSMGERCVIAVSYTPTAPVSILSSIAISIEQKDKSSIEIPLDINVDPLPVVVAPVEQVVIDPRTDPNDPRYINPNPAPVQIVPTRPTDEQIARQYFAGVGGVLPPDSGPMAVISLPESMRKKVEDPFLGGSSALIGVETISQDPRFPDSIASTEASLPVDTGMIITADRVIKAVLDTPFSNVMCGKVVALVESDVYSSTSSSPLIQAGSRVIGRCGTLVKERAGIVWERIITVDGRSISLNGEDSMTRDAQGLGGALGTLYRTPFDRYVLPIFGTFVDVGAGFVTAEFGEDTSQEVDEEGNIIQSESATNAGIETATTAVQTRAQDIITELQDVREVMIVPAGTRIDIEVFEDIYFKDNRDVVRLADTVYDVSRPESVSALISSPDNLELIPYRSGLNGPVVELDGRRYVVNQSAAAPISTDPQAQPARPSTTFPQTGNQAAPNSENRPDTQATLNDLSN
jgi:type IV secretory pathway VirB10-like protein